MRDIQGFFFSPCKDHAMKYGPNIKTCYLNIVNPAPQKIANRALKNFYGQH
jgi:hypothetical protein